jgi:hypothetical protein
LGAARVSGDRVTRDICTLEFDKVTAKLDPRYLMHRTLPCFLILSGVCYFIIQEREI